MFSKLFSAVKNTVVFPVDVRVIVLVLTLVLFILGAGAPGTHGGLGG
jgi:hypothetical protein